MIKLFIIYISLICAVVAQVPGTGFFSYQKTYSEPAPTLVGCTGTKQYYNSNMYGCYGAVTYANRASLCAPGWNVCSVSAFRSGSTGYTPSHNYWVNEALTYAGSGPGNCQVNYPNYGGASCGATPMRVCMNHAGFDPSGNYCNWYNCGWATPTPIEYFGGCSGNPTAGTVCCQ